MTTTQFMAGLFFTLPAITLVAWISKEIKGNKTITENDSLTGLMVVLTIWGILTLIMGV